MEMTPTRNEESDQTQTTTTSKSSSFSSLSSSSNNSSILNNETFIIGLSGGLIGSFILFLFLTLVISLIAYKLYKKYYHPDGKKKKKKPSQQLLNKHGSYTHDNSDDGNSIYEANHEEEDARSSTTFGTSTTLPDDLIHPHQQQYDSNSLKPPISLTTSLLLGVLSKQQQPLVGDISTTTTTTTEQKDFASQLVEEGSVTARVTNSCHSNASNTFTTTTHAEEEYGVSSPLMSGNSLNYQQQRKSSSLHHNYDSLSPRTSSTIVMPSIVLRNLRNEEQVIAETLDATNNKTSSPRISIMTSNVRTTTTPCTSSVTFINDDGDEYEIESDTATVLQQQGYGELDLNDPIHLKRNEFLQFLIHQRLPKFLMTTSMSSSMIEATASTSTTNEDTFSIVSSDAENFMMNNDEFSNEHVIFKDNSPVPTEAVTPANLEIDSVKGVSLKGILKIMESNENVKKEIFDVYEQLFPTLKLFIKFLVSQKDQEIRQQLLKYLLENYICDVERYSMYKSIQSFVEISNTLEMEDLQRILVEKAMHVTDWKYPNAFSSWSEFLKSFEGTFSLEPNENGVSENVKITNSSFKERSFNISKCIGPIRPPLVLFFNHPKVIAEHLTAMDALLFRNVNTHKDLAMERYTCLNGQSAPLHKHESSRYSATSCPSLSLYIEFFNKLGVFTKFCIFYKDLTVDQRATCIERLIIICEHLERLGNYNSLMAIYSALTSQSVSRMKNVWDKVSESSQNYIRHLEHLFMIRKKFENLRRAQFTRQPPLIPYFGIFMTEMTQIESIHNTYLDNISSSHVNMAKLHQIYKIHQQIETCQLHAREYLTQIPLNTNLFNQLHDEIIGFDIFRLESVIPTLKDGKTPSRSMSIDSISSTGTDGALTPRVLTVFSENSSTTTNESTSLLTVPTYEDSSPQTTPRGGKRKNLAEVADKEFLTQSLLIYPKSRSNSNNASSFFGGLLERLSPKRLSFSMSPTSNNNLDSTSTAGNTPVVSPRLKKFSDSEPTLSPRMREVRNLADYIK